MNRKEVGQLFFAIKATYPNYYKNISDSDIDMMLTVWEMAFASDDSKQISQALATYIKLDTSGFPPSPGQIRQYLPKPSVNQLDAESAWQKVIDSARLDVRMSQKNFDSLPHDIQKALGGWGALTSIASANIDKDLPWRKREFLKAYNEVCKENLDLIAQGRLSIEMAEAHNALPERRIHELCTAYRQIG